MCNRVSEKIIMHSVNEIRSNVKFSPTLPLILVIYVSAIRLNNLNISTMAIVVTNKTLSANAIASLDSTSYYYLQISNAVTNVDKWRFRKKLTNSCLEV